MPKQKKLTPLDIGHPACSEMWLELFEVCQRQRDFNSNYYGREVIVGDKFGKIAASKKRNSNDFNDPLIKIQLEDGSFPSGSDAGGFLDTKKPLTECRGDIQHGRRLAVFRQSYLPGEDMRTMQIASNCRLHSLYRKLAVASQDKVFDVCVFRES